MKTTLELIRERLPYHMVSDIVKYIGYNPHTFRGCGSFPATTGELTNDANYIAMLMLLEHSLITRLSPLQWQTLLDEVSKEIASTKLKYTDIGQNDGIRGNITKMVLYRNVFVKYPYELLYAGFDSDSRAFWKIDRHKRMIEQLWSISSEGELTLHLERTINSNTTWKYDHTRSQEII